MCYKQKCKVVSLNLAHPVRLPSFHWSVNLPTVTPGHSAIFFPLLLVILLSQLRCLISCLLKRRLCQLSSLRYRNTQKTSISYSASKTHLPESLPITLSHKTHSSGILKYFHWLSVEQHINFKLSTLNHDTLCSTPLTIPFWIITLPHVMYTLCKH